VDKELREEVEKKDHNSYGPLEVALTPLGRLKSPQQHPGRKERGGNVEFRPEMEWKEKLGSHFQDTLHGF